MLRSQSSRRAASRSGTGGSFRPRQNTSSRTTRSSQRLGWSSALALHLSPDGQPYPAGGGTDIVARLLVDPLRADLGQPVLVDNRVGAGGNLGAEGVARSPGDGYSLLVTA